MAASSSPLAPSSKRQASWRVIPSAGLPLGPGYFATPINRWFVCQRLVAAGIILRASDPAIVCLDAVLSEQEAQLGGVFLDMAHAIEL